MAMTVTMPQLGESVTEGTIARWLKQPGEFVAKYESIAEVVTDKVNAEIPAPADGSMGEHIAKEGEVIAVGQPICTIETTEQAQQRSAWAQPTLEAQAGTAGEEPAAPHQQQQQTESQSEAQPAAPRQEAAAAEPAARNTATETVAAPAAPAGNGSGHPGTEGYHLTPAVRALVREHDVDLSQIMGSGLGGRITKKDVLDYVEQRPATPQRAPQQPAPAPAQQPAASQTAAPEPPASQPAPASAQLGSGDTLVPLTPMRRAIAEHMVRSKQTSPHAWLMVEVDMTRVARLRSRMKEEFRRQNGVGLTFLPFVARATCESLRQFPMVNATWGEDGIIQRRDVHLGIAVALEDNLIVPVVRNADRLSISGLATTMAELAERARENRLKLEEIQGGTFTLNNTGALGTVLTQPIINQPQAGILAMDAVVKRPVVVEGDAIAVRSMMNLCLSFDHRIIDGLQAARFVRSVKEKLESIDDQSML